MGMCTPLLVFRTTMCSGVLYYEEDSVKIAVCAIGSARRVGITKTLSLDGKPCEPNHLEMTSLSGVKRWVLDSLPFKPREYHVPHYKYKSMVNIA